MRGAPPPTQNRRISVFPRERGGLSLFRKFANQPPPPPRSLRRRTPSRRSSPPSLLVLQRRNQLEQRCVTLRRKGRKASEEVEFLKEMNGSLESNKSPTRTQIAEAQRGRVEVRDMVMACLPSLEEQVQLLMMRLVEGPSHARRHGVRDDDKSVHKKPAARRR